MRPKAFGAMLLGAVVAIVTALGQRRAMPVEQPRPRVAWPELAGDFAL